MAKINPKIIFFIALVFSIIMSCKKNQKLNIIETKSTSSNKSFQKNWARKSIPQKWIEIKKDEKGYLIYQPCEGNTVTVDFNKKSGVELKNERETENFEYNIRQEINSDDKFFITFLKDKKQVFEIEAREYDAKNQIALFKIHNHYYLMTPYESKDSFRKVENKCVKEKVDELEFLPIN